MSFLLRVLHLEDDPADGELVEARLTSDGLPNQTVRLAARDDFVQALRQGGFDIILADQNLPAFDGLEALALAREVCPEVPFIFVSGVMDQDQALDAFAQGATDFVFKDRLIRLAPTVRRALQEHQERANRQAAEAQLRQQAERQAKLARASRVFAAAPRDYQELLQVISRTVHELTGDACTVRIRSQDGRWLEHVVTYHPDPAAQALQAELKAAPLPVVETIGGHPVQPGQSLLVPVVDPAQLQAFVPERLWPLLERFPIYSLLAVPLSVRGQAIGALIVTRGHPTQPFNEADQGFLESLADHAALAMDNARTYQAEQAARQAAEIAAERAARLQTVTAALTAAASARAVADVITQQSASALQASASSVYLLEANEDWLSLIASVGIPEPVRQAIARLSVAGPMPAADVFRAQAPQWLRSNDEFIERYPALAPTRGITRNQALVILPLSVLGLRLGTFSISFAEPREFTAEDKDFLLTLAGLCAQALERARLYDTERQLREAEQQAHEAAASARLRLEFLAAASAALAESLDYEATLQTLTRQLVPSIADWCLVDLLEEDGQLQQVAVAHRVEAQEGLVRQLRRVYPPQIDVEHPILRVIQTQQPILAEFIRDSDLAARARTAEHLAWLQALDIHSHIVVPLVARGQAIGALSLVRSSASPAYGPVDLALAEEVARRAAQAIDNARLYREAQTANAHLEHRVAERTAALAEALQIARQANDTLEREVTVRRRAEQRFRHLLESAPDATVIVDAAGRIQLANSQTERLFGYPAEALHGQPVETLIPERFSDRHQTHRLLYVDQPRPRVMGAGLALFGRRRDGSEFPIEVSLGPLQSEEGLLISCAIRDITERQQTADALSASHAQLQALMARVQSVREEERTSLAREVHDELGQQLSGLKMDIAWLRKWLPPEPSRITDKLESMSALLDVAIQTVRHIASELRPGVLDDFGLLAAIEWQLGEFEKRSGLTTRFKTNVPELTLPTATATAAFRVFQESLTNIARHARATAVTVTAAVLDNGLLLEIEDNGEGFDPGTITQKHTLGLAGMRERVQACAGTLTIGSVPGQGTKIQVRIPLAEAST